MKKLMIIATVCTVLAACAKSELENSSSPGPYFEKGQKVTLVVGNPDSKAVGTLNSDKIDFTWNDKDEIKVTVGTESAKFTLKSGAGTNNGTFEGVMPGSGNTFDIQYPYDWDYDTLNSQTYSSENAVPKDMMLATKKNCSLGGSFQLEPQCAIFRLQLYWDEKSYGSNDVGKIDLSTFLQDATGAAPKYTLSCGSGVTLGKDTPTSFFIIFKKPTDAAKYRADVYDTSNKLISIYATSSFKTFEGTNLGLSMPPKKLQEYPGIDAAPVEIDGVTWAPVNCGYEPYIDENHKGYPRGKLYQWGRRDGTGFGTQELLVKTDEFKESFVQTSALYLTISDYFEHPEFDKWYTNWEPTYDWSHVNNNDPCPSGWRVPISSDLDKLINTTPEHVTGKDITGKGSGSYSGYLYGTSPDQVFIPMTGFRYSDGTFNYRNSYAYSWCSTNTSTTQACAYIWKNITSTTEAYVIYYENYYKKYALPVRCVKGTASSQ